MREVSFVKKIKFKFDGNVTKNALIVGDADNDQKNELVCANLQGDLAIFKDSNTLPYAQAKNLGMVTACCIGDFINQGKNHVAGINMEGWLYMFDLKQASLSLPEKVRRGPEKCNDETRSTANQFRDETTCANQIAPFYQQRMPANCKVLLVADLDGDGQKELIIGLTDRVLRTYRWINIPGDIGKFIGIYKWEFADQIGAVSLNPSQFENCLDIIVAQPGGTFAKLECIDKKTGPLNTPSKDIKDSHSGESSIFNNDNVKTEKISRLTPEYHQLAQNEMRNNHISTEVLGRIKCSKNSENYSLIVVATLDGTLMLVNKDDIVWTRQLDHQLFALATLTNLSKGYEKQYFVVCAWNGKTYIFDEERNHLAFKFSEAVSAFTAGNYYFDGNDHSSLVYATFKNEIILYFDVTNNSIRPTYLFERVTSCSDNAKLLSKLFDVARRLNFIDDEKLDLSKQSHYIILRRLLSDILRNVDLNNAQTVIIK